MNQESNENRELTFLQILWENAFTHWHYTMQMLLTRTRLWPSTTSYLIDTAIVNVQWFSDWNIIQFLFSTYHILLFALAHGLLQFEICSDGHCFLYGQIRVKLIVLHDVAGQFLERVQIPFMTVDGDGAFHSGRSEIRQIIN